MTPPITKPLVLVILDGWGFSPLAEGNAIALARTPYYDAICRYFPMTTLTAAGERVGQTAEATGNAEIGHSTIGTGRAARSESVRIEDSIRGGDFFRNEALSAAFANVAANGGSAHLIGLLSDGGVNSSTENLFALLRMAKRMGVSEVFVHAILDGVDVPPRTADVYVEALEIKMADIGIGRIATLCGRHFAMDGQSNWERTARTYTMLVHAEGERSNDAVSSIRNSFLRGIADEFIAPVVLENEDHTPVARIKDGDTVVYFNHRAEFMRQLVRSLSVPDSSGAVKPLLRSVCLTEYDRDFDLPVAFRSEPVADVLADVLSGGGIRNVKITQSERFPHLTYFFNGGADAQQQGEQHILVPTPQAESVENCPESQTFKITDKVLRGIEASTGGVFVVNVPAADLAAETGQLDKTVEAVQYIDTCIGGIVDGVRAAGGVAMITSSHGNCEEMTNAATGEPQYLTTRNSVPFHLVSEELQGTHLRADGSLADIAPTIIGLLGLDKPAGMTGRDLRML